MNLLLGVDIGTTKLCVVAFDAESGRVQIVRSAANDASLPSDPDAAEQDASQIVEIALKLVREAVGLLPAGAEVSGIGVTGQMHGVLVASSGGYPLSPLVTWQDQRGNRPYDSSGRSLVQEVSHRLGAEALRKTGTTMATGYGAATLFRMSKQIPPDSRALTIHDYLVWRLTGEAATDPSDAASWGIYDVEGQSGWLPGVSKALGIKEGLLPKIVPTGSVVGHLLPKMASSFGLPSGTPVAIALGDNQASFIGSVPSIGDSVLFNFGTGGQMSMATSTFARKAGLDTRPLVQGKYLMVGASLCGGSALKILAEFFSSVGADLFGTRLPLDDLYGKMIALADKVPSEDLPTFAPSFFGTRQNPDLAAELTGLRTTNFNAAHLTRSLTRGMVAELVSYYDLVQGDARYVVSSGNGFRRNAVLRQELAICFGEDALIPPNQEEAAVGAALSAGVAVGLYSDWDDAGRVLYSGSLVGEHQ